MTVTYDGNFLKAIFRWHGSVWKYVWKELLAWLILYYIIRIVFFFARNDDQDDITKLVKQFNTYCTMLPLEFLLGFYVAQTLGRWWNQVHYLVIYKLLVHFLNEIVYTEAAKSLMLTATGHLLSDGG